VLEREHGRCCGVVVGDMPTIVKSSTIIDPRDRARGEASQRVRFSKVIE
jgi:hypothetical protein